MYYELEELKYRDDTLSVTIVTLMRGEPDGAIGIPLVVGDQSNWYKIEFQGVTDFRSQAEPCFNYHGEERQLSDYLFECFKTEYLESACPFGAGAGLDPPRHYYVFTESVVINVLSMSEPIITTL